MTIKHIVLAGGGPAGFVTYGALRELHINKFWNISDIKSIYGCSIGAYMGLVISLGYEWDILDNYFIKRPWNKLTNVTPDMLIDLMTSRGIFGLEIVEASLEPLLSAKGLSCGTSLLELYEYTGIELIAYTVNINDSMLTKIPLSYKTFPELSISLAMAMSMAVPVLFAPIIYNGGCYVDGGLLTNLPVNDCLNEQKCDKDEIFVMRYEWEADKKLIVNESSSLVDYLITFLRKAQLSLSSEKEQVHLPYWLETKMVTCNGIHNWINILGDEEMRKELISQGKRDAIQFMLDKCEGLYDLGSGEEREESITSDNVEGVSGQSEMKDDEGTMGWKK